MCIIKTAINFFIISICYQPYHARKIAFNINMQQICSIILQYIVIISFSRLIQPKSMMMQRNPMDFWKVKYKQVISAIILVYRNRFLFTNFNYFLFYIIQTWNITKFLSLYTYILDIYLKVAENHKSSSFMEKLQRLH